MHCVIPIEFEKGVKALSVFSFLGSEFGAGLLERCFGT
jgi:hypothetical protein